MRKYCEKAENTPETYDALVKLLNENDDVRQWTKDGSRLCIQIPGMFRGNLCAPLGVILRQLQKKFPRIMLYSKNEITNLFLTNNFYPELMAHAHPKEDVDHIMIHYREFPSDINMYDTFTDYLDKELLRDRLPQMSDLLWGSFTDNLAEIFNNAVTHSECDRIFACGQYFKDTNRLDFSIADSGIGIRECLSKNKIDLDSLDAIEWAITKGNTTKTDTSGGLGLSLVREFIELNKGRLQIISDTGFWEWNHEEIIKKTLIFRFPGTIINIEIDTSDASSYCLVKEMEKENNTNGDC